MTKKKTNPQRKNKKIDEKEKHERILQQHLKNKKITSTTS